MRNALVEGDFSAALNAPFEAEDRDGAGPIMYLGRFVEQGTTSTIFRSPAHPYTEALLGAVPRPDPRRRRTTVSIEGEVPSLKMRPRGCEFHPRCPYVQERCRHETPATTRLEEGHLVRCHFPLGDGHRTG